MLGLITCLVKVCPKHPRLFFFFFLTATSYSWLLFIQCATEAPAILLTFKR